MDERTFTAGDGVEVFFRSWSCEGARGVVVVVHGASEHSARYDRFARALNDAGYAVYALDQRGHGHTSAATGRGRMGPGGGDGLVDDIRVLVAHAEREAAGVPIVVFGHSMGSAVVQAYVTRHGADVVAYALSGSPGPIAGAEEIGPALQAAVDGGMADEPIDLLGGFNEPFEPARTKFDWLSRDEQEVDKYVADQWCGDDLPLTYGFVNELFKLTVPATAPEAIARIPTMPVLMIAGELDPVGDRTVNVRELEERLRRAGLDVTARYYPGARHELLNETNRDDVTADVVGWLDSVIHMR